MKKVRYLHSLLLALLILFTGCEARMNEHEIINFFTILHGEPSDKDFRILNRLYSKTDAASRKCYYAYFTKEILENREVYKKAINDGQFDEGLVSDLIADGPSCYLDLFGKEVDLDRFLSE